MDDSRFERLARELAFSDFILQIIDIIAVEMTPAEINKIERIASHTPFTEISIHLLQTQNEYKKCIDKFFESSNSFIR
jgi:hypothetical protein